MGAPRDRPDSLSTSPIPSEGKQGGQVGSNWVGTLARDRLTSDSCLKVSLFSVLVLQVETLSHRHIRHEPFVCSPVGYLLCVCVRVRAHICFLSKEIIHCSRSVRTSLCSEI